MAVWRGRFLADVTVPTDSELAFATVTTQLGTPDLVVACAGTAKVLGLLWLVDPRFVVAGCRGRLERHDADARAAVSRMLPCRTRRLVTVYGNLGDRQMGNVSAFAVAKAGIARLTETLAYELDGTGIRVFCVHPGFVRTPMTEHLAWSAEGCTWLPRFGWTAQQRWGDPQPAADLVEAIALGAADQLSGRAVLETMGYAMVALIQSRGQLAAVDGTLLLRGLLSPAGHMAWTGLTAAALWHTAARGWSSRAVGGLVGTYVLAVVLHTLWDSLDSLIAYVVLAVIALGLLGAITHRLARGGPGGAFLGGGAAAVAHDR